MAKIQKLTTEEARKQFAELLNGSQFRSEHTEITRHGKVAGVLVPGDWYTTATQAIAEVKALRKELATKATDSGQESDIAPAATVEPPAPPHVAEPMKFAANIAGLPPGRAKTAALLAYERANEEQQGVLVVTRKRVAAANASASDRDRAVVEQALKFDPPLLSDDDLRPAD